VAGTGITGTASALSIGGNAATANAGPGGSAFSMRNRIINGDMRIDQRNNGAAQVVGGAATQFIVDRIIANNNSLTGTITVQQSSLGGSKSALVTATAAVTDLTLTKNTIPFETQLEVQNISDLNSKVVTLSFKVQTNWAGNFAVVVRNSDSSRSFVVDRAVVAGINDISVSVPFEANTIFGASNSRGLFVNLAANNEGTYRTATVGAWVSGVALCSTASTQWAKTAGNFINVTDVQLEQGSVATPFERRPIGLELALCRRYLPAYISTSAYDSVCSGYAQTATTMICVLPFDVVARVQPTGINIGAVGNYSFTSTNTFAASALILNSASTTSGVLTVTTPATTAGVGGRLFTSSATEKILFLGCEL
jgi:hypothetical protein